MIRVLYVDDETILHEPTRIYLTKTREFSVDAVPSVTAAFEKLKENGYDAIVSDYQMPGTDGITFLQELRHSGNTIPFIIFTGKGREDVVIEALNSGADFYLQKGGLPKAQFAELMHKIRVAVQRRRSEEELRTNEERLRMAQGIGRTGSWEYDLLAKNIWASPEAFRMFGLPLQENGRISVAEITACIPGYENIRKTFSGLVETGGDFEIEFPVTPADGSRQKTITCVAGLIRDANKNPARITGVIHDITERKDAEKTVLLVNEALSRQTRTLSVLNRIINAANQAKSSRELLDEILEKTLLLLDYDAGGIYIVDRNNGTASIVTSRNLSEEFLSSVGTVSLTVPTYENLLIRGIPIITDHYDEVSPAHAAATGFCSLACAPLISQDRVIGSLNVASRRRYVIPGDEKTTLISIGRELGSTIERMASEEEVKKAAQNIRTLFNSIDEMVFVLDTDGKIIRVNETAEKMLHFTRDELPGRDVLSLHPPDRRDEARYILEGMIAGTVNTCSVPLIAKDSTLIEVETTITRGIWDNRNVLIGISRDVTDSRRVRAALNESEEKYRLLVENAGEAIAVVQDLKFVFFNPRLLQICGYTPEELRERPIIELAHPDDRNKISTNQRLQIQGTKLTKPYIIRLITKSGEIRWIDVNATKIVWNGAPATLNFYLDITDRRLVGEALKNAEERYRNLVDNSHGIIYMIRPDGVLTYVSPSWKRLLGHEISEVVGHNFRIFIHPDDVPAYEEFLKKTVETKTKQEAVEYRGLHKDGSIHWHRSNILPVFDGSGNVISLVGNASDFTDYHRAVDALAAANQKLNLLSGITRHDIRNQLMVLVSYLGFSKKALDKPEELAGYIAKEESVAKTIERQLSFTRDYENMGVNAPVWQNVGDHIADAVSSLPAGKVSVTCECPDIELLADPLLGKVFYNLLDNALRYGGPGLTFVRVTAGEKDGSLACIFEDNGAGIDADDKEMIFSRGFGKNTGYGLFLVREILSISGITVTENGVPGKGGRFEMTVPHGAYRTTAPATGPAP